MQDYFFKRGKTITKINAFNVIFALNQYLETIQIQPDSSKAVEILKTLRLCREESTFKEWVVSKCGKSPDPSQNIVFIRVELAS